MMVTPSPRGIIGIIKLALRRVGDSYRIKTGKAEIQTLLHTVADEIGVLLDAYERGDTDFSATSLKDANVQ